MRIELIRDDEGEVFVKEVNEFCKDNNVKDIQTHVRGDNDNVYSYTAIIIYEPKRKKKLARLKKKGD